MKTIVGGLCYVFLNAQFKLTYMLTCIVEAVHQTRYSCPWADFTHASVYTEPDWGLFALERAHTIRLGIPVIQDCNLKF